MVETSGWVNLLTFTTLLYYIVPIVFVIWFVIKYFKIQKERNELLRQISEKLDKPQE